MEVETTDITLKFDEELVFQGLYEGDEDPEEKQTDGFDKQPSKDKEESKSNDPEKGTKGKKVTDSGPWHVPCSADGCKICDNKGLAKPKEDRKSKLKGKVPENLVWKFFVEGVNVTHFEGGFFLTEKRKPVTIRAPVNTMIWQKSRNVPVVERSEGGTFDKNKDDPQFTIPIYQGYLPVSPLEIGVEGLFIYTGNKDNKSETQNQYMLFEDLRKRLEKGCETVYKEDWNKLRNGERPFDVWNAEGTLIKKENNFLDSISKDLDGDDWLVALFRLYCDIANSAQRTPSEPWTVKARFWSKGIVNDGTILGPETFTVLFDSNVISDTDLKDCIGKVGKALCLKAPQKTPFILPDTCRLEGQSTWDDLEKRRQELTDQEKMVAIGRHPQVIYEIWVKLDCLRPDFWARSYRFRKDIETNLLEELEQNPNKAGKTETIITTKSISAARNYPRTAQVDVMGGKSANDIAQKVWCDSEQHCTSNNHQCTVSGEAEWLHRSAFSFGGISGRGPQSSQVRGNLVLGTKETNTKMIRREEFIKRFVRKTGQAVKLTTSLEADANGNATRLNYLTTLPMPINFNKEGDEEKAEAAHAQLAQSFYALLERKVPTLFEVLLDVEVDKNVYRWGTSEKWVYG